MWHDVKHPRHPGRLLLRYDPERHLIQIAEKGEKHVIDLREYEVVIVENPRQSRVLDKSSGVG